jgi:hypothetical protein
MTRIQKQSSTKHKYWLRPSFDEQQRPCLCFSFSVYYLQYNIETRLWEERWSTVLYNVKIGNTYTNTWLFWMEFYIRPSEFLCSFIQSRALFLIRLTVILCGSISPALTLNQKPSAFLTLKMKTILRREYMLLQKQCSTRDTYSIV